MDNAAATAALPTVRQTFKVPRENISGLRAEIEKLNKRARRNGLTEIQVTEGAETVKVIKEATFFKRDPESGEVEFVTVPTKTITFVEVEIVGETPRVNGWDFIATLQHLGEEGNIIRSVPGFEGNLPVEFRTAKPLCAHCHTFRARKDTYVLRNVESGEYKQIGTNCLADFIRTTTPEQIGQMAEYLQSAMDAASGAEEEGWGGGVRGNGEVSLLFFMATVVRVVEKDGAFVSRTKARIARDSGDYANATSTVDVCQTLMFGSGKEAEELRAEYPVTAADVEKAGVIIAWARENLPVMLEREQSNDYIYNLSLAMKRDSLDNRLLGIAGSAIAVYNKDLAKKVLLQKQGDLTKSVHFGTEKERIKCMPVTLLHTHRHEGIYGVSYITKLLTDDGNVAIWFGTHPLSKLCAHTWTAEELEASRKTCESLRMPFPHADRKPGDVVYGPETKLVEYGERVYISATVKKHGERDGIKQTILGRVDTWTEEGVAQEMAKREKKAARAAKKVAKPFVCARKRFPTIEEAQAHAQRVFERTGAVVAIENRS